MTDKPKSEGVCFFCGKTFAKASINRHLKTHLDQKQEVNKTGKSFLIKVEPNPRYGGWPHFLSLWVDGETTIKKTDGFLRDIWLDCCGHLSAFCNPDASKYGGGLWDFFEAEELLQQGKIKEYERLMEDTAGEVPLSRKAKAVFYKDLKLEYTYDFGSPNYLLVTTLAEFTFKADKPLVLLSRNEPLEILCETCKKAPATQICSIHNWDEDYLFCDKCAKIHKKECPDFGDYAAMPVINSPRMGVCGYTGGVIDTERDGIFQK